MNKESSSSSLGYDNFEVRYEATFSNGHGFAKAIWSMEDQGRSRQNSYPYGWITTSKTGIANGNDVSFLSISIGQETYSIEFTAPEVKGTMTTTSSPGSSKTVDWRENDNGSLVTFEPQKLGKNPNVLSGTFTEDHSAGEVKSITTISWGFVRGPINEELIVTPVEYNSWLPVPGIDEMTPGSQLNIGLLVRGKNGKPLKVEAKYFELKLHNTSQEQGTTINFPIIASASPQPDMKILPAEGVTLANNGQSARLDCEDGSSGSAIIAAFDGAAISTLVVEAVLENGMRLKGELMKPGGATDIVLPKRAEGSRIATTWLQSNGDPSEEDDLETSPGNDYKGDGLSTYEEYRGVWTQGKFKRLNPKKKKLGVRILKKDVASFKGGIELLKAATGIDVIELNEDELGPDRIFNRNSHEKHKQYGLCLYNTSANGNEGVNVPSNIHNKTPKMSDSVIIDINHISSSYEEQLGQWQKATVPIPYTLQEDINSTTAHELAHGIHVSHHGPPSDDPPYEVFADMPLYHIYNIDGGTVTRRPFKIHGNIGEVGNEESGDINCIMLYPSQYQWVFKKGDNGSLNYYAVPPLPQGKHFCTSAVGTGINAKGYFGPATLGNCLSQIKIKDND
ncbi:MAG: hypothetical protein NVS1B13_09100 [Flavisolibacter sp.]